MAAAKKKSKCPSSVAALTKALAKASVKQKVTEAKKHAEARVLALIKSKGVKAARAKLDRTAKKYKAVWET